MHAVASSFLFSCASSHIYKRSCLSVGRSVWSLTQTFLPSKTADFGVFLQSCNLRALALLFSFCCSFWNEEVNYHKRIEKQGRIHGQYQLRTGGQGRNASFHTFQLDHHDRRTDQRPDGRTDGRTKPLIELRVRNWKRILLSKFSAWARYTATAAVAGG